MNSVSLKEFMSYLANYIPNQWNKAEGCVHCLKNKLLLPSNEEKWPTILIGLFVDQPTPFTDNVLTKLKELHYPKNQISIRIHNKVLQLK